MSQDQRSLDAQLQDLKAVATERGMYDAADHLDNVAALGGYRDVDNRCVDGNGRPVDVL